jgi:hypothetical protein
LFNPLFFVTTVFSRNRSVLGPEKLFWTGSPASFRGLPEAHREENA